MTDLLPPRTAHRSGSADSSPSGLPARRRLMLVSAAAGVASPVLVMFVLWAVGLAAWFNADGGSHGTTTSVLRLGADGWLLAHGAHIDLKTQVGPAVLTSSPLGLTLVCLYVTFRVARWAAARSSFADLREVGFAGASLAGGYAVTGTVAALLASTDRVAPGLVSTFLGCLVLGGLSGAAGLVAGAGRAGELRAHLPLKALSVGYTAIVAVTLMVASGAVLVAASLALHGGGAARIADGLDLDFSGGVFSLLLLLLIAPNTALLACAYLVGPGFAVGAGTTVSPAEVSVGALPSVPVLAALPSNGPGPSWALVLMLLPVVLGAVAAYLVGRTIPALSWRGGAGRGLVGGLLGAFALSIAVSWAGGAIGPGRMRTVGAPFWDLLIWAGLALGLGGLLGGLVATWWARRKGVLDVVRAPRPPRRARAISLYPRHDPRYAAAAAVGTRGEQPVDASDGVPGEGATEDTVTLVIGQSMTNNPQDEQPTGNR